MNKEIEIVRRFFKEDFEWNSIREGRAVVLSAREKDTNALAEFLLKEQFER